MANTVVELFAGMGSISKVFWEKGYKVSLAVESDKYACQIFSHNLPDVNVIENELTNIEPMNIPASDILVSKLPMSIPRNPDNQNSLFIKHILDIVAVKKPKVILFECVKRLLVSREFSFDLILKRLKNLGYSVVYKLMNARDYTNLPYDREKIYIIGFKDTMLYNAFSFPEVKSSNKSLLDIINIREKKADVYYKSAAVRFLDKRMFNEEYLIYRRTYKKGFETYKDICPPLNGLYADYLVRDDHGIR
ncbi:hypothetical protein AC622_11085 [Bacillus sp. FJAT-27916]|uniref:DNA cytosine methyltransferase n=1 Tax=Bacillus sp. FJAT-27916 TaxID=1679169 RepID=UPI000671113D|nr:DNA (cytosine-5-)-methyltransferase [Bacillus sp. FJAT-27916]KMY44706.1 hypothetical protein AC622_11085 [Bacillus sp. FJAT-27916]